MTAAPNPFVHQSYRGMTARTNRFGQPTAPRSEDMTHCPHCRSTDVCRNKIPNMPLEQVAQGCLDAYKAGKVVHACSAAAVWGLVELFGRARQSYACNVCRRVF